VRIASGLVFLQGCGLLQSRISAGVITQLKPTSETLFAELQSLQASLPPEQPRAEPEAFFIGDDVEVETQSQPEEQALHDDSGGVERPVPQLPLCGAEFDEDEEDYWLSPTGPDEEVPAVVCEESGEAQQQHSTQEACSTLEQQPSEQLPAEQEQQEQPGPHEQQPEQEEQEQPDVKRAVSALSVSADKALQAFRSSEPFEMMMERRVPGPTLQKLTDSLIADWRPDSFFVRYLVKRGCYDIHALPWMEGDVALGELAAAHPSQVRVREVSMQTALPPPMYPTKSRVTASFCLITSALPSGTTYSLTLVSSKISHDVPFGERFVVQEKLELTPSEGAASVDVRISGRVVFLQSCHVMQPGIYAGIMAMLRPTAASLLSQLQKEYGELDVQQPRMTAGVGGDERQMQPVKQQTAKQEETTRIEEVWELQRRPSLMSRAWAPPALQQDGAGKMFGGWVDGEYQAHHLCRDSSASTSPDDAAECDEPPLEAPEGWRPIGAWQTLRSPKTDSEGWQYSTDFKSSHGLWGNSPWALHVRKRCWTRCYEKVDPVKEEEKEE